MKLNGGPIDGLDLPTYIQENEIREGQVHVINLSENGVPKCVVCYKVTNGALVFSQEETDKYLAAEPCCCTDQESCETTPEEDEIDEEECVLLGKMKVTIDLLEAHNLASIAETLNIELKLAVACGENVNDLMLEIKRVQCLIADKMFEIKAGFNRMNNAK